MGKRKDNKGRVLKTGESQRSNGTYSYRYEDFNGKRRVVYAKILDELRQKEAEIQRNLLDGIDDAGGEITVTELLEKYKSLRRDVKFNSNLTYQTAIKRVTTTPFGHRKIKTVKKSDAIAFFISLHDKGLKQNTISIVHNILRPAFEMAVEDDAIRKNPFKFKLCDIISNDADKREALTKPQQEMYLAFAEDYKHGACYDEIIILLETGLRVSELCGLTKTDLDFERRCIHINKQLCRIGGQPYYVTYPKSESGVRDVPMSDKARQAFFRILRNRKPPKVEKIVDGYGGFLLLNRDGNPKVAMHIQNDMRGMRKAFIELYGNVLPDVTPHILRHTFCSNMAAAGISPKILQMIMGHSDISTTFDIYTHMDYSAIEKEFFEAVEHI